METYVTNVNKDTGISPSIITAILAFIQSLIGACPTPPAPADIIAGGGIIGNMQLNRAIRSVGIRPWTTEGRGLAASMQANAAKVSEADAKAFLSMSSLEV